MKSAVRRALFNYAFDLLIKVILKVLAAIQCSQYMHFEPSPYTQLVFTSSFTSYGEIALGTPPTFEGSSLPIRTERHQLFRQLGASWIKLHSDLLQPTQLLLAAGFHPLLRILRFHCP